MRRFATAFGWTLAGLTFLYLLLSGVRIEDAGLARQTAARSQIAAFQHALDDYRQDVGEYPTEAAGLAALRVNPGSPNWKGPYFAADVPVDPLGVPYRYRLRNGHPEIMAIQAVPDRGKR